MKITIKSVKFVGKSQSSGLLPTYGDPIAPPHCQFFLEDFFWVHILFGLAGGPKHRRLTGSSRALTWVTGLLPPGP